MNVRKVPGSDTGASITLTWDPVPGADGYRFYSAGVLRSTTMDPKRTTVTFSKGQEPYVVEAVVLNPTDSGQHPPAPTPPPIPHIKVAPRTAYAQGGSDARYCLWVGAEGGELRPGLVFVNAANPDEGVRDEVAQYDLNGLCKGGRSDGLETEGLVGAREMDGRPPCELPMVGDPTTNTGSWRI